MKYFFKNKQNGQALVSGIIFLIFTLLFSVFFLFMAESYFRNYSNIEKARQDTLKQSATVANKINQIAVNNQTIITALSFAQSAYAEAAKIGLYIGFAQPYWETYGIRNGKLPTEPLIITKEHSLSDKSTKAIKNVYKAYMLKSARGLYLAKSLSEKNKNIIAGLPPFIANKFMRSSNSDTFCYALETQSEFYRKSKNSLPLKLYNSLYNFYLEKDGCTLKHKKGILNGKIPFEITIFSSSEPDKIFSYKDFDNILKNVSYGIWYVEPKNAHNFLDSLYFESQNMVSENKKFIVISNAISKIPYFSKLNINKKIYLSGFSKKIKSRITHSNFVCSNHSNWNGDFLTESDFKNAN